MCAPLTVEDLIKSCGSIENAERRLGKRMVQAALAERARVEALQAARIAAQKPVDVVAEKALDDGWPDDADLAEFYEQHALVTVIPGPQKKE